MAESVVIPEFDRDVPTGEAVPIQEPPARKKLISGTVEVSVEELTAGLTSRKSLFQVSGTFRVVNPPEYAGALIWENFVIGDDEDTQALKLETWGRTVGGSRFRKLADRLKVPFGKLSVMVGQMVKKTVVVDMYTFVEPPKNKDGTDNAWAGKERRRIRDFYTLNEKPLKATGTDWTPDTAVPVVAPNPDEPQTCPVPGCGQVVAAKDFPAHVNTHD